MCTLFPSDDAPFDPQVDAALQSAIAALTRFVDLGTAIANGATRRDFPGHNADAAITKAVGEVTRGFFDLRLAVMSASMRERCMLMPNPETVKLELQRRVTKNEAETRAGGISSASIAVAMVNAAAR
ncbi:hypothetical protein ACHWGL_29640, partial [Klebsiella pneumoniae]|uniref:hypothetical protein n=1 Tax=Klebsiella pneumoniae TaxID=573 RepID=UPI00376F265E